MSYEYNTANKLYADGKPNYAYEQPVYSPRQLSFDDVTTNAIYDAVRHLQDEVAHLKAMVGETPELLKDLVEQMNSVLSALDDFTQ
jgi:hypothetical protein